MATKRKRTTTAAKAAPTTTAAKTFSEAAEEGSLGVGYVGTSPARETTGQDDKGLSQATVLKG